MPDDQTQDSIAGGAANDAGVTNGPQEQAADTNANAPAASASTSGQTDNNTAQGAGVQSASQQLSGQTLTPAATAAQPALIARVEVLQDVAGNYHVHPFAAGRDLPAYVAESLDEIRGALGEFFDVYLAA